MAQPTKELTQDLASSVQGDVLFATLLDALPVATALISRDGFLLYANARFLADFHPASGTDAQIALQDLVHSEDQQQLLFGMKALLLNPKLSQKLEIRVQKADATYVWMLVQMTSASLSASQSPQSLLIQLSDIHAVKTTAMHLQKQESRWNSALVSSGLGVWDHNFATGDFFYSDTWKLMRGIDPSETVAADTDIWIQTVHPDDRERVLSEIGKQNSGEVAHTSFEYRERHSKGHWIWIECRGACVEWDSQGLPVRVIGTDTDISDRKAAEALLTHVSRRLDLPSESLRLAFLKSTQPVTLLNGMTAC